MKDELFDIQQEVIDPPEDGEYPGLWSGYIVKFSYGGRDFRARTNTGIRGLVDCTITFKDGKATVSTEN